MKEKKTVQKSIRMTPRVDNYVNSFPGEGFNEKFENLVLFVMEHENNIQKNIVNSNQHLISLNNLIENKREILSKLQRIENQVNCLLNQIGDVK